MTNADRDTRLWQSLPEMFLAQAARLGDRPFLWRKQDGAFRPTSYIEADRQVRQLANGLVELGVEPGDRVALVAENRPEWLIADHAIMAIGAITVPAFVTNTQADHLHVLTHSGAKGVIVSSRAIAGRLLPAALESPDLKFVISLEPLDLQQRVPFTVQTWDAVLALGAALADDMAARVGRLKRDDVSCIIYTSGTGGTPKGVMLSHGSILCNCAGAIDVLAELGLDDEVFLSFLPLSHSYEHTAGQFLPVAIGGQIYYAESVDKLMDNMAEARPTLMMAVPRLYEVMHQRIQRAVEKTHGLRRKLFDAALALGCQNHERPGSLSPIQRLVDALAERLVRRKLRQRFGGRLKALVSGGAALNYDLGLFFTALGVRILQGYGQTEAAPIISVNLPSRTKLRTVGPPVRDIEVRIAEDGEILARGELVMKGYWRDPEATAAALRDGWLHTGDIGLFDRDGDLQITDRKKDIIVFSGGDNVSPARIEGMLILQPEIAQAMIHGDRRPHLVALLVPDGEFAAAWALRNGQADDLAVLVEDARFIRAIGAAVDRVNGNLSVIERVRRFALTPEPFTIDNGMMTPSLKIRRHKIRERHGAAIDRLYEKVTS